MKKISLLFLLVLLSVALYAQNMFNYQAIIRDSEGNTVKNTKLEVGLIIVDGFNSTVYDEEHFVSTDNFGVINLKVGSGTPINGDFDQIDWGEDLLIRTRIRSEGTGEIDIQGESDIASLPKANYAYVAERLVDELRFQSDWHEDDSQAIGFIKNKPSINSSFTGNYNDLSGLPDLAEVATSGDYNDLENKPANNGQQSLILEEGSLSISEGNTVDLSSINSDNQRAIEVSYSNSNSGINADNVQDAIDALKSLNTPGDDPIPYPDPNDPNGDGDTSDAVPGEIGQVKYNTITKSLWYYSGSKWVELGESSTGDPIPYPDPNDPNGDGDTSDAVPGDDPNDPNGDGDSSDKYAGEVGQVKYNLTTKSLWYYDGTKWVELGESSTGDPIPYPDPNDPNGDGDTSDAVPGEIGQVKYNTSTKSLWYYDGTKWVELGESSTGDPIPYPDPNDPNGDGDTSDAVPGEIGQVKYNTTTKSLWYYDGTKWVELGESSTGDPIPYPDPNDPNGDGDTSDAVPGEIGQVKYNTTTKSLWYYDGTKWIELGKSSTGDPFPYPDPNDPNGDGDTSDAVSGEIGQVKYNTSTKSLWYYDGTKWVELGESTSGGPLGGDDPNDPNGDGDTSDKYNGKAGDIKYNTTTKNLWYYDGTTWNPINTDEQLLKEILAEENDADGYQIKNLADPTDDQDAVTRYYAIGQLNGKVDKETGKGLSANNYTDAEKAIVTDAEVKSNKNVAGGYPGLDSNKKIDESQLPKITVGDVFAVNSEAEQLALTASRGDVAVRSDENKTYIHNGGSAGDMTDWTEMKTPSGEVFSVNGKKGDVNITIADIPGLQTTINNMADLSNVFTKAQTNTLLDKKIDEPVSQTNKLLTTDGSGNLVWANKASFTDTDDQTLSLNGNKIKISEGNEIDLTPVLVDDQSLSDVLNSGNDGGGKHIKNILSPVDDQDAATKIYVDGQLTSKVDKVSGKGLSSNDYTDAEKAIVAGAEQKSNKNVANGYPGLDANKKIDESQLPKITVGNVFAVDSQAEQLALSASRGDVAVRSDENKTYIHNGGSAGDMTDWTEMKTPSGEVYSVNGKKGDVLLNITDIPGLQSELDDKSSADDSYTKAESDNLLDGKIDKPTDQNNKMLTTDVSGNLVWADKNTFVDTDDQTLSISGTSLSIVNGNSVDLSAVSSDDQTISKSGAIISLEDGGSITLNDDEITNELQDLTGAVLDGSGVLTISIENGTEAIVDLSTLADNTDDQNLDEVLTEGNSAGGNQIKALADPTNDQDAATKIYVDNKHSRIVAANMTTSVREAHIPLTGELVFDTDTESLWYWDGDEWIEIISSVSINEISFTNPKGGEEWINNASHLVSWTYPAFSSSYSLYYKVDGGGWQLINGSITKTNYQWTPGVINSYSDNVVLKTIANDTGVEVESLPIKVYPPFNVSIARTGNGPICESLDPGSFALTITGGSGSSTIQWYEDDDNDLSADATTVGLGATTFDPTGIESSYRSSDHTHYVGAIATDDNLTSISKEVEVSFGFVSSCLTIDSPVSGNEWVNNTSHSIAWTAAGGGSTYDISYSTDGGSSWIAIVNNVSGASYSWTPSGISVYENDVKIKVHDDTYNTDAESDLFTVYPPLNVSIARTGSGPVCESLDPGSFALAITGGSGSSTIQWYEDNDNDLSADATTVGLGATTFDPTGIESSYQSSDHTHYVGAIVTDDNLTSISKEVEVSFGFVSSCLTIDSPVSGNEWVNNTSHSISWTAASGGSTYDISYSTDGGSSWNVIQNNVSGVSYNWTPSLITTFENDVKIKVHDDVYNTDAESELFTVYPPFNVSIARTGSGPVCENLDPGSFALTITGGSGSSTIQWYEDNDNDLSTDATTVGSDATSYDPSGIELGFQSADHTHYVGAIVTDDNLTSISQEVEVSFSFVSSCLVIDSPVSGNEWVNNTSHTISWTAAAGGSTYDISYSTDGGSSWNVIQNNVSGVSYNWTPSTITSYEDDVKIKVHDDTYNVDAESDLFTVYLPFSITVTRTGSGDICDDLDPGSFALTITGGSGSSTIQWYEDDDNDLSADATTVGSGVSTYDPSTIEAGYLSSDHVHYIGAIATDDILTGITSEHEVNFSYSTSCISLTAPISGTKWVNNSSQSISWTNSLGASTYTIAYSTDNGSTWNNLTTSATGTSYGWVPSVISSYNTTVKIKLTDNSTSKEVISDAFTVYPPITVSVSRSGSGNVCGTEDLGSFTVTYSGGSGSLSGQWYEHSNGSLSSGVAVGDGSNGYNPSVVHGNYRGSNHTHYVGVVVTDATLGVTGQSYSAFTYNVSCGPPIVYIESTYNGQWSGRFICNGVADGTRINYHIFGTVWGGQISEDQSVTVYNNVSGSIWGFSSSGDWLQLSNVRIGNVGTSCYTGVMNRWEAPKNYYTP